MLEGGLDAAKNAGFCEHGNFPDSCPTCLAERPSFEEEHHPEIVENGKGMKRLERLDIKEDLASPEKRAEYFKTMTNEQYKKMLGYINSITRGEPIRYEFEDGQLPMSSTPELAQKEPLMNETFAAVREILDTKEMPHAEALQLAALTLAGALNYTHPYKNGNGRSGRSMHYLMEFGAERGDAVFEQETYAIIAKLPAYKGDKAHVIDDTPPPELEYALVTYAREHDEAYESADPREQASIRVRTFLSMMKGEIEVPINEVVVFQRQLPIKDAGKTVRHEPGEIDGRKLYLERYRALSTAPNRVASEIPKNAIPNKGKRHKSRGKIEIPLDLI